MADAQPCQMGATSEAFYVRVLLLLLPWFCGKMQYNIIIFSSYRLVGDSYETTGAGRVKCNTKTHHKPACISQVNRLLYVNNY